MISAYPKQGTHVASAPRSKTSPSLPIKKRCNILVKEVDGNGTVFGFVSAAWNRYAEYGPVEPSQNGSLEVSFSYSTDSLIQLDLLATNGPSARYPFVGGTSGFASTSYNLSSGSYNYVYITGTTQTPPGSPPVEDDNNSFGDAIGIPGAAESAIWTYDPVTNDLSPQWVNVDGSTLANYLIYANDFNNAFIVTGDPVTFRETFGAPYPRIAFTCVAPNDTQGPL
ncbi:unnamed protein product [Rhizoctonia solani]|uniref:Uncharacterized protein n=1 Tax=Rhizoctonia solani TaxID=456999 RepID=A0A8H2Y0B3_9AGAM|nr:unnamed protein product [Rhizoctonia solani]